MRTPSRKKTFFIVAAVVLFGGFAVFLSRSKEPRYEGRTLTRWLQDYLHAMGPAYASHFTNSQAVAMYEASTNAVGHIGTNAIPFLLKKLTAKDNTIREKLKSLARKQSFIQFHFVDRGVVRLQGREGFEILGKEAISAAPDLVELTKYPDKEVRGLALGSLNSIGAGREVLLPVLLRMIHDEDHVNRSLAEFFLNESYPEEAKRAGVYEEVRR